MRPIFIKRIYYLTIICIYGALAVGAQGSEGASGKNRVLAELDLQKDREYAAVLRFQEARGDYLIFYDAKGVELYLKYRIDRWDSKAIARASTLRHGAEYLVAWRFLGYARKDADGRGRLELTDNKTEKSRIRNIQNILAGIYIGHTQALNEDIRF